MARMQEGSYTIGELAKYAGVTTRTVRYYCAEGLLPPPDTTGRYASYSDKHLCRLRLIARWKNDYLPLHEIRARLANLTTGEIIALLESDADAPSRLSQEPADSHTTPSKPSRERFPDLPANLAHFVEETLSISSDLPATVPERRRRVLLISPMLSPTAERFAGPGEGGDLAGGYVLDESLGETWKRIPLAPGVELHFRLPDSPEARDALNRVIAQTQDAFKLLR